MKKVIIIGGGIGGLCAAIAFQKKGLEAHIYEKVPQIKGLGAGITLSINARQALKQIGLYELLIEAGQELKSMSILDEKGKNIAHTNLGPVSKRYGLGNFSIHRAALHEILLAKLVEGSLHCGKSFAQFSQDDEGVQVYFEDGAEVQGDVLLAFDGIHSAVRRQMFPDSQIRYSGYTCWRAVIDYLPEGEPCHATETWGRGKRFGLVPLDDGKLYWFATANASENDAHMKNMGIRTLQQFYSDLHHPIEQVLEMTTEDQLIWNDITDLKPLDHYCLGKVALAGDAAHATTPNMGQGAGMAIEDAVILARLLSEKEVRPALKEYEIARIKRTQAIVNNSYRLGAVAQWEKRWLRSFRNAAFRMIPVSAQERQMRQLYEVEL